MSKYLVGGILAVIALMVIYGTSASSRIASWMDGENPVETDQGARDDSVVGINPNGTDLPGETQPNSNILTNSQTPLQQAGQLPQRQISDTEGTIAQTNLGDGNLPSDTETPVEPAPVEPTQPAQTTPPPAAEPIRALW